MSNGKIACNVFEEQMQNEISTLNIELDGAHRILAKEVCARQLCTFQKHQHRPVNWSKQTQQDEIQRKQRKSFEQPNG